MATEIEDGKIYPIMGLSSIGVDLGGAWRAWSIARAINLSGDGRIATKELRVALQGNGVSKRSTRRWIKSAIDFGFVRVNGKMLYLTGLVRACEILGADKIGIPVEVKMRSLLKSNWRSLVFAGYNATLHERPVSQKTKELITGISPRVQRNYQAAQPGTKRVNIAETEYRPDQIGGIEENQGGHCYVAGKKVLRRLPDTRIVPKNIATPAKPGRTRKYQKALNARVKVARAPFIAKRLFHNSHAAVNSTIRNLSRANVSPWYLPCEVFQLKSAGVCSNLWTPINTGVKLW